MLFKGLQSIEEVSLSYHPPLGLDDYRNLLTGRWSFWSSPLLWKQDLLWSFLNVTSTQYLNSRTMGDPVNISADISCSSSRYAPNIKVEHPSEVKWGLLGFFKSL